MKLDLDRILEIARRYPDQVQTMPCTVNTVQLARANRLQPTGTMRLRVPDEWVVALRGDDELRPLIFCIYIPRQIVDVAESGLILPGLDVPNRPTRR